MKLLSLVKSHKLIFITLLVAITLGIGYTVYAVTTEKKPVESVASTHTNIEEEPIEAVSTPPVEKPQGVAKTEQKTVEKPVQTPKAPTQKVQEVETRPNYLHASLKDISESNEEKAWRCFELASDNVKQRNDGFDNVSLIAQVSRNIPNPCGTGNDSFLPDGKFLASYVEWCIKRSSGESVPPIVAPAIASKMCAGF